MIAKISKRAKAIRAANPKMEWQTALKKASAEIKSQKTTSKRPKTRKPAKRSIVAGKTTKTRKPAKRLTRAQKEYNADVDAYKYFIVDAKTGKPYSGWEYRDDAKDGQLNYERGQTKIVSLATLKKSGNDVRANWKNKISGKVGNTKTIKPKIKRSPIPLDKLNGIIILKKDAYYEIESGPNKGSVFQLMYKRGVMQHQYFVKFWTYRNGKLSKPFEASFDDFWLEKRSIIPRGAVKPHETIGFAL